MLVILQGPEVAGEAEPVVGAFVVTRHHSELWTTHHDGLEIGIVPGAVDHLPPDGAPTP
jgi:hypothetical protein